MATKELTVEEKRQFDMKRSRVFKGTIVVIVIYGVLLLILTLLGIFLEVVRKFIFVDGFIFTVTLMAGIVLVILMLLIQIFSYKQAPREIVVGENLVCPEYWELTKTKQDTLDKITDPRVKSLSTYHCKNPSTTTGSPFYTLPLIMSGSTTTEPLKTLKSVADHYNKDQLNTEKLTCSRLYPEYMAFMDKVNFPDAPTTLRTAYLKQCAETDQTSTGNIKKVTIDWPAVSP